MGGSTLTRERISDHQWSECENPNGTRTVVEVWWYGFRVGFRRVERDTFGWGNAGYWTHPEGFSLALEAIGGDQTAYYALLDWMQEHLADAVRFDLTPLSDCSREGLRTLLQAVFA